MKQIRMLQTAASPSGPKIQGKTYFVEPAEAEAYVKARAALVVEEPREAKSAEKKGGEAAQAPKGETREAKPEEATGDEAKPSAKKTSKKTAKKK